MRFINSAPDYWKRDGGAHWSVEIRVDNVQVCISALRPNGKTEWTVLNGDVQSMMPASYDDTRMWDYLKELTRTALTTALAEIE